MASAERPVPSYPITLPGRRFLFLHRCGFEMARPFLAPRDSLLLFIPFSGATRDTPGFYGGSHRPAAFGFLDEPEASRGSAGGCRGDNFRRAPGHGGLHTPGAEFRMAVLRGNLRHPATFSR